MLKSIAALVLVAACVPFMAAQSRGGRGPGVIGFGFNSGVGGGRGLAGRFAGGGYYSSFFGDPYYYADFAAPPAPEPPPQYVIVQPPSAPDASPQARTQPLLIEWQNGKYVQIHDSQSQPGEISHTQVSQSEESQTQASSAQASQSGSDETVMQPRTGQVSNANAPAPQRPPAVLVFRDGHREQVGEYTISSGALYVQGQYWTDGYWNRKVQLSSLNLPATQAVNRQNGVNFLLPNSPSEVVTGP
jgi:hypothetical protein